MERKAASIMVSLLLIGMLAFAFYSKPVRAVTGDVTGEGDVDGKDIAIVAAAFGSNNGTDPVHPRWNPVADIIVDGRIDGRDIWTVASNFGTTSP